MREKCSRAVPGWVVSGQLSDYRHQLGYKNLKYITRLTATDSMRHFGKGLGSPNPEYGYAWFAGI